MRPATCVLTAMLLAAFAGAAFAKPPRAELAGLRLGMSEEEAHERLARLGTRNPAGEAGGENEGQESWALKRGPWGYVALSIKDDRVAWVSVFARKEGPRIRYRDLGTLAEARRTGAYFFTWRVPAAGRAAPYTVIARGTDSVYVASVSLAPNPSATAPAQPSPQDSAR